MKFSFASCVAAMAAVVAAKPSFTNSNYNVVAGESFELKWNNANGPVTLELKTGNSPTTFKTFSVLATGVSGTSATVQVPKDLPSGQYAFTVRDGEGEANTNYSPPFPLVGTGVASSTSGSTSASTSASTTVRPSTSVSSSASTTMITSTSASANSNSTTASSTSGSSSSSSSSRATGTNAASSPTITPPNNTSSGVNVQSSLALILLGAVAVAFLN